MAKISLLPPAGPTDGTERVPMVQGAAGSEETVLIPLPDMVAGATRPTQAELIAALLLVIASGSNITVTPGADVGTIELEIAVNADLPGAPTADTAAPDTNTRQLATTAFVQAAVTALVAVLATKAPSASPDLTGTPTAPTAVAGTNTTQIASTAFVQAAFTALIGAAPATLDQINELAAAIGNDPNFAVTLATSLAGKQGINAALTAISALATTAFGRDFLVLNDAAAARAKIGANKYRFGGSIESALDAGAIVFRHVLQADVTFADDFAGSIARRAPGVAAPGADQVLAIKLDGVAVGSVTIAASGARTWVTIAGALAATAGQEVRLEMPPAAPAAELLGASFTFFGLE